jgi:hypothetical protein
MDLGLLELEVVGILASFKHFVEMVLILVFSSRFHF